MCSCSDSSHIGALGVSRTGDSLRGDIDIGNGAVFSRDGAATGEERGDIIGKEVPFFFLGVLVGSGLEARSASACELRGDGMGKSVAVAAFCLTLGLGLGRAIGFRVVSVRSMATVDRDATGVAEGDTCLFSGRAGLARGVLSSPGEPNKSGSDSDSELDTMRRLLTLRPGPDVREGLETDARG